MERRELGKYIVADPDICNGAPTFRGARIIVRQVLEMVAGGMDWDEIGREWEGKVSKEALAEALLVAARALARYENRRPAWLDDEDCNWLEDESLEWPEANQLGRYIVADPRVCHGQVTFRGTRIFVEDALEMAAKGMDWDEINRQWHNRVSREAIAEAVRIAAKALDEHQSAGAIESEHVVEMISR